MAIVRAFKKIERPAEKGVFQNLPGWKFDEGLWIDPSETNSNFTLPSVSNLDLQRVPRSYFRSGVLGGSDLELDEIRFEDEQNILGWTPGVLRGNYFVFNSPHYLHSSTSTVALVGDDIDEETLTYSGGVVDETSVRSCVELTRLPSANIPISIAYFQRDPSTFAISEYSSFKKVAKFTGYRSQGIESDGDLYPNTDTTKDEFKIVMKAAGGVAREPLIEGENLTVASDIAIIYTEQSPIRDWKVQFSRPDIFRTEIPFSEWHTRRVDPGADPLEAGQYAIGYQGSEGDGRGILLYLGAEEYENFGTISYWPNNPAKIIFNKDVRLSQMDMFDTNDFYEIGIADDSESGQTFYLPIFPVQDRSIFEDADLVGNLVLDTQSFQLKVDGVLWTRVESLDDVEEEDDQNVYELDPIYGEIRFGNGGLPASAPVYGARPEGAVTVKYTAVPLIRYDADNVEPIFFDSSEDLDPLTNALKRGFLVLDNRRLTPWKIELTTMAPAFTREDGTIAHGKLVAGEFQGLEIPPMMESDVAIVKARVIAKGNPPQGVPNIPVHLISKDGLMVFTQDFGVTDGDGYVYTEVFGKSNFSEFVSRINFYKAMPEDTPSPLNPDPASLNLQAHPFGPVFQDGDPGTGSWHGIGDPWTNNVLLVPERVTNSPEEIYIFIVSIPGATTVDDYDDDPAAPEEYLVPYNGISRTGGLTKVWSYFTGSTRRVVHPVSVTQISSNLSALYFDRELIRPVNGGVRNLIMAYEVVIDRTARIEAQTVESPILISNEVEFNLTLNRTMKGQWKLPNLIGEDSDGFHEIPPEEENDDSSRIGTAVFLSPNDIQVDHFENSLNATVNSGPVGMELNIIGTFLPDTEELKPSVFIIKATDDGGISSIIDITNDVVFVSGTKIKIPNLPEPPTGVVPGSYHIAVGGFHPGDDSIPSTRRTSKVFSYTA